MSGENIPQFYWDTCIFIAHLNDDRGAYGSTIDDIGQFLDEAKVGKCRIHCSTLTIAEITKHNMKPGEHRSFSSFLADFRGAVIPLAPDPNIMALASELRSLTYTKTGGVRKLHTPDAIHLASAIALVETYGIGQLDAFHTFDNGKTRGLEGPGTPLLTFETWCESCADDPLARKIIDMKRCHPLHPEKKIL